MVSLTVVLFLGLVLASTSTNINSQQRKPFMTGSRVIKPVAAIYDPFPLFDVEERDYSGSYVEDMSLDEFMEMYNSLTEEEIRAIDEDWKLKFDLEHNANANSTKFMGGLSYNGSQTDFDFHVYLDPQKNQGFTTMGCFETEDLNISAKAGYDSVLGYNAEITATKVGDDFSYGGSIDIDRIKGLAMEVGASYQTGNWNIGANINYSQRYGGAFRVTATCTLGK